MRLRVCLYESVAGSSTAHVANGAGTPHNRGCAGVDTVGVPGALGRPRREADGVCSVVRAGFFWYI